MKVLSQPKALFAIGYNPRSRKVYFEYDVLEPDKLQDMNSHAHWRIIYETDRVFEVRDYLQFDLGLKSCHIMSQVEKKTNGQVVHW